MKRRSQSVMLCALAASLLWSGEVIAAPTAPSATPTSVPNLPACHGLDSDDSWVKAFLVRAQPLLVAHKVPDIVEHAVDHRLQIVVGEVRGTGDTRCIDWHPYRLGAEYFYPASMIKPLAALAALDSLRRSQSTNPKLNSIDVDSPVRVEVLNGTKVISRRTTTLFDELRAALVVSNNDAFNFLFDLAGRHELNKSWWDAGLKSVHLTHRLAKEVIPGLPTSERLLVDVGGETVNLAPIEPEDSDLPPMTMPGTFVGPIGSGKVDPKSTRDFSMKNGVSLLDMARLIAWIADPNLAPDVHWRGTPTDRELVRKVMNTQAFDWALYRPLRAGMMEAVAGDDLTFVGKPGEAYGFFEDVVYAESRSSGRALVVGIAMLAEPTVGVNATPKQHRYDEECTPFFLALGDALAHELLTPPKSSTSHP
jgi:hypothetical protein